MRYSEDIDLVQLAAEPIGAVVDATREALSWLGNCRRERASHSMHLVFKFKPEADAQATLKLKVEINTREHAHLYGIKSYPFAVDSDWYRGKAEIASFEPEELFGTKLRALLQRRKSRDLFDLYHGLEQLKLDPGKLIACFDHYLALEGNPITRAAAEQRMLEKLTRSLTEDIAPLLPAGIRFNDDDALQAFERVWNVLIARISGDAWRRTVEVIKELRAAARTADRILLAADPDREGEAICQHLKEILDGNKAEVFRVLFNEITPKAIRAAIENPGRINQHIVDAQQARRILDRLVGYQVSPLLWDKVRRGISAGRVQTVALRMIVEREREIQVFVPEEYWSIIAKLEAHEPPQFSARLVKFKGKNVEVKNQAEAGHILDVVRGSDMLVESVVTKEKKRNPVPPFTTSKLQQDAARRLRFTVKKTMMLAQRLYEGIELGDEGRIGLITYMRTDSTRISDDAMQMVRLYISDVYGGPYLPEKPVYYRTKKDAQDAH